MADPVSRLTITPAHPCLGARVEGVDLTRPVDAPSFQRIFDAFLVMWDNRCVLHRGRPWDAGHHRRVMRRTTVAGEGPTADPPLARRIPVWQGIVPEGVGV